MLRNELAALHMSGGIEGKIVVIVEDAETLEYGENGVHLFELVGVKNIPGAETVSGTLVALSLQEGPDAKNILVAGDFQRTSDVDIASNIKKSSRRLSSDTNVSGVGDAQPRQGTSVEIEAHQIESGSPT
jgi:hypothetical protein